MAPIASSKPPRRAGWAVAALLAAVVALPAHAQAALRVLACEPEWGALVEEIAGDRVEVSVATSARQDPHRIEARPSLIAQARRAGLIVCTGAELEAGWLPLLLRDSGNARIQPGQPGHFEAAAQVDLIERPERLDRSEGDVHAAGNPHIHLDPYRLLAVADALAERLALIDPPNAERYREGLRSFEDRWREAIPRWEARAAPLRGASIAAHHANWSYLAGWLGMRVEFYLEPQPGIEPSVAHLARLAARIGDTPVSMVLKTGYQSPRAGGWLADRTGVPLVELPYTVGGSERAGDLFGLYDDTLDRLLGALR